MRRLLLLLLVLLLPAPALAARPALPVQPLERAHAHNDYEHPRPLLDALDQGFASVEADVYLVGTELLVAHDPQDLRPGRTLQALYLDPLRSRTDGGAAVLPGLDGPFQLLVDVKTDPVLTYLVLDRVLQQYGEMLWSYEGTTVHERAVQVVVSGNRAQPLMARQAVRYAAVDGRFADLGSTDALLTPLISDSWANQFTWRGEGPMPSAERTRLREAVATAHARGQRVRLWATPDAAGPARERVWAELVAAGVDHLNTDDLAGLAAWLKTHDPREQEAA